MRKTILIILYYTDIAPKGGYVKEKLQEAGKPRVTFKSRSLSEVEASTNTFYTRA